MSTSPSHEELASKAAFAFNAFYERTSELYHDTARSLGLSDSAFDILYALHAEDGQRQAELCKASMMPKQTLASSLRRLQEQGLVRIESESRKMSRVFLTPAGRARAEATIGLVIQAEVNAVDALPSEVLALLPETLERYLGALSEGFLEIQARQRRQGAPSQASEQNGTHA